MPRYSTRYQRSDPAEEARKAAAANFQQQRQAQTSAYAAARFQEWAAGAQDREALLNARLQNQQSRAEMEGAQLRYGMWKDQELQKQVTAYYTAMPALQESLKNAGIYEGSPRYAQEMAAFAAEIPRARTLDPNIRKELHEFSQIDADQAHIHQMMAEQGMSKQEAQIANLKQSLANEGQHPTSFTTTSQGGVDVKATRPDEDVQKDLFTAHKLTRTQFENFDPNSAKIGTLDDKGNLQLNQQGTGGDIQFKVIKDGKSNNVSMPISEFNRYKVAFGQAPVTPQSGTQGTPTPAPTATATPAPQNQIPTISSKDDYDAVPGGAQFMSGGKLFTKPAETPQPNQE